MGREIEDDVAAKLLSFVEQSSDFIGVADPWGRVLYLNPAACKRLGVADYSDLTLAEVFPTEAFSYYYEIVRPELLRTGAWSGEVLVNNATGPGATPMYISTTAQLGPGGETQGGVVFAHDLVGVTPVATGAIDDVSGLLDRTAFRDQVGLAIDAATQRGELCALVLATVDLTETIERHGALTATNVVRALSGRMTRLARTIDVVGRVGEHQLGLLLRGVRSHNEALRLAGTIYDALVEAPVTTPSGQVAPSVACGLALAQSSDSADDLIERAAALTFSDTAEVPQLDYLPPSTAAAALATIDEFVVGMSHGDVQPYASPVVDLGSGRVVGYQGVARWHHRDRGVLDAEVFTEIIADSPLANQVDLYVTREVAAMLTLLAHDDTAPRVYAPVSRRLVADVHTEQYLWEIADAFSLRMEQLCLQVGRSLLESWSPALQDALVSLHDAGVTLVVTGVDDDEDARRLVDQGFDELHLSPALGLAAASDAVAWSTVHRIVAAAHEGERRVAATAVDDLARRDAVVRAGVDLATGQLYGEPAPTDTIE